MFIIVDLRIQLRIASQVGVVLKSCSDTVPEGARTGRRETAGQWDGLRWAVRKLEQHRI